MIVLLSNTIHIHIWFTLILNKESYLVGHIAMLTLTVLGGKGTVSSSNFSFSLVNLLLFCLCSMSSLMELVSLGTRTLTLETLVG